MFNLDCIFIPYSIWNIITPNYQIFKSSRVAGGLIIFICSRKFSIETIITVAGQIKTLAEGICHPRENFNTSRQSNNHSSTSEVSSSQSKNDLDSIFNLLKVVMRLVSEDPLYILH